MSARRGVLLFLGLATVLFVAVVAVAVATRRPSVPGLSASVLVFDVPATLEEDELPARAFSFARFRPSRPTLYDVTRALREAAGDDRVRALVLHVDHLDWGWAKVGEVRDAIRAFRRSGKPVYASLGGGGEVEYLLASAADYLTVPPTVTLQLDGLAASALFMRGTFDKVGVRPNFARVGRYKSAIESYTREDLSEEAREVIEALLDDTWSVLVDSLAHSRGIPAESMARLIEGGPYWAADARARGLVDGLHHRDELDSLARHPETGGVLDEVPFSRYALRGAGPTVGPRVALIHATGTIAPGRSREEFGGGRVVGAETLMEALRDAREQSSIRAVVLRVDSPGGSGQASDDIWREVERVRAEKPVVVSMSDLAASGGYYIAAGADRILAQPLTITGSIGVYAGKLNILGLYRKLGLNVETLTRGPRATMLSPFSDFSEAEAERFQEQMDAFYRVFLDRVASGRGLPVDSVDAMGQGRVWSGRDAGERGLVDGQGGLEEAIEAARELADIPATQRVVVERFPRADRSLLERLLESAFRDEDDAELALPLPPVARAWIAAARFPVGATLALLPFSIEIR